MLTFVSMASNYTVDIRVSLILKEFILSTNNSDKLYLNKRSDISNTLFTLLKPQPEIPKPIKNRAYYIRLVLPYNETKDIRCYNYLDEQGQFIIFQKLNKNFKLCFHNFMLGKVKSGIKQSEGITDFCTTYFIKCDNLNYEMLKKSWDRSYEKLLWKKSLSICPLIY